ncbi:MAG: response regulator, partial [Candidatus Omnitrophica bacterium]|nr:response regulator [Candidatus Omnitrophota bacterium]
NAVAEMIGEFLLQNDFQVTRASDGLEGVEKAAAMPDLILLDLGLPKLSGLGVLKKLKSDNNLSAIPIIVLTGQGDSKTIFEAMDLGSYDFMIKPVKLQEMLDVIMKAVHLEK